MLFSEPKIPQYRAVGLLCRARMVSVLFSEPKIPQWQQRRRDDARNKRFSALQRAENSSIDGV